jgi:hypothetical protein
MSLADISDDAARHSTRLVDDGLTAVGTTLVGFKEGFVALGAVPGKDRTAVRADFRPGDELHAAPGAGEGKAEVAVATTLSILFHGRAAPRAKRVPTGGAHRITDEHAGTALGAHRTAVGLGRRFVS